MSLRQLERESVPSTQGDYDGAAMSLDEMLGRPEEPSAPKRVPLTPQLEVRAAINTGWQLPQRPGRFQRIRDNVAEWTNAIGDRGEAGLEKVRSLFRTRSIGATALTEVQAKEKQALPHKHVDTTSGPRILPGNMHYHPQHKMGEQEHEVSSFKERLAGAGRKLGRAAMNNTVIRELTDKELWKAEWKHDTAWLRGIPSPGGAYNHATAWLSTRHLKHNELGMVSLNPKNWRRHRRAATATPATVVPPKSTTTMPPATATKVAERPATEVTTSRGERFSRSTRVVLGVGAAALALGVVAWVTQDNDFLGNSVFDPGDVDMDIFDGEFAIDIIDQDSDGRVVVGDSDIPPPVDPQTLQDELEHIGDQLQAELMTPEEAKQQIQELQDQLQAEINGLDQEYGLGLDDQLNAAGLENELAELEEQFDNSELTPQQLKTELQVMQDQIDSFAAEMNNEYSLNLDPNAAGANDTPALSDRGSTGGSNGQPTPSATGVLSSGQNPWSEAQDYATSLGYKFDPNSASGIEFIDAIKDREMALNHLTEESARHLAIGTRLQMPAPEVVAKFYNQYVN